jgi:hypothetical protein
MSKEDVITQLERTIQDKEKAVHGLQKQLSEEANKTNRLHEITQQIKNENDRLSKTLVQRDQVVADLQSENNRIDERYQETRNEIDYLHEEIKTLEFKLAHSQKEGQDFKSLLESFDMKLLSSRNALELKERLDQVEIELNDVKNENVELNAHIFALDEFMRDKEQQCDQLEEDNGRLHDELNKFKTKSNTNNRQFMENLQIFLNSSDVSLKDVHAFLVNLCFFLKKSSSDDQQAALFNWNSDPITKLFRKARASRNRAVLKRLQVNLKSLNEFYANDTSNIGKQMITYMSEQLMHRAIMNGQLKFVCEAIRKNQGQCSTSAGSCLTASNNGSSLIKTKRTNDTAHDETSRDENIFRIASELLLYDEDSLRRYGVWFLALACIANLFSNFILLSRLSGQLLNEAEHLNQLDCVLRTVRKLRRKQYFTVTKEMEQIGVDCDGLVDCVDIEAEESEDEEEVANHWKLNFDAYLNHITTCKLLWILTITQAGCERLLFSSRR